MFSLKRFAAYSMVAITASWWLGGEAVAGGGFFPSIPATWEFTPSSDVTATIVLDPNGPVATGAPATLTGAFGTIAITRAGVGTAASAFQVEPDSSLGELRYGCNLSLTQSRFVEFGQNQPGMPLGGPGVSSGNWLPSSLTQKLFGQLNVPVGTDGAPLMIPGIASVLHQQCSAFPTGNAIVGNVPLSQLVNALKIKPTTSAYPDRTLPGSPNPQWYPGFLILQVTIGFWGPPSR